MSHRPNTYRLFNAKSLTFVAKLVAASLFPVLLCTNAASSTMMPRPGTLAVRFRLFPADSTELAWRA
jgi:hypothetical protein